MILYELFDTERHEVYEKLARENLQRQYDFLRSIVEVSLASNQPMISSALIKALNYHAIACLHTKAGEYRPCDVTVGDHQPPAFHRVPALMDHFINSVNASLSPGDPWFLSAFCLWRFNYIHPFINGNGRTARALCYYVLCLKAEHLLPGATTLPQLLTQRRAEYVGLLKDADARFHDNQPLSDILESLSAFIMELATDQINTAGP